MNGENLDFIPDIEKLRLPKFANVQIGDSPLPQSSPIATTNKIQGEFLKGPIPLAWLTQVSTLPGKGPLAVALAIWFESGRKRSNSVCLTTAILRRFFVDRKAKYRALRALEEAGLIQVKRIPRRNPVVTLVVV